MSVDGFSLYALVRELNAALAAGRIDRVSQPDKHTVLLAVRQPGQNRRLVICVNPQNYAMHLTDRAFDNPTAPPVFCMVLRKHLENGRIAAVVQHGTDRAVSIHVDVHGGKIYTKTLIVELMGKHSNLILVQDGVVIDALKKIGPAVSRVRQILPGRQYLPPPNTDKFNLFTGDAQDFAAAAALTELPLAKAVLAAGLGIGPVTAREICQRAGLPPDLPTARLDASDRRSLAEAARSLVEPLAAGRAAPTVILNADGKPASLTAFTPDAAPAERHTFATMSEAVAFAAAQTARYTPPEKTVLQRLIGGELAKSRHKLDVLRAERAQAEDADRFRRYGDLLMANLYRAADLPPHADVIELPDLYSPEPEQSQTAVPLDPLLSLLSNANAHYARYNKLKRARRLIQAQIDQCGADVRYLESIDAALELADAMPDILEIRQEAIAAGYLKTPKKNAAPSRRAEPLQLFLPGGFTLLIGRNNYQNDAVTFKQAGPDDIWLHVKDSPGSHVVLRAGPAEPPAEIIQCAARVAAWFSKSRASAKVPVDYTRRRFVKKPSGAKPGFVVYTRQKTLYVTPDPAEIERLSNASPKAGSKPGSGGT